jgi:hypothetical protein
MPEPIVPETPAVPDAAADQAALDARIDAELGIDSPPVEGGGDANDDAAGDGGDDAGTPDDAGVDGDAEAATDDGADAGADDAGAGDEDESGDDAADDDAAKPEDATDDKPVVPGDADDLFVEVEDAEGNKLKITKIEDLPEDFTPKNNRQVIEILDQLHKLEAKVAANKESALEQAEAQQVEEAKNQQMVAWDNEISELQKGGRLEKPKAAADSAKFLEDPAVKKVSDVFNFIAETNKARLEKGNPNMIKSFEDALDLFEAKEARERASKAAKADTATAKEKAGVIGRASAPAGNEPEAYRAGQAQTIWDV